MISIIIIITINKIIIILNKTVYELSTEREK